MVPTEFQCGIETKCRNAMRIAFVMKFQWETDQYSTALDIRNPSVESRLWEEKNEDAK